MSQRWMDEHLSDPYVKQSKLDGYPSRAAYKLLECQQKDKLIKPGMQVVDLGAAPGGWSMVARDLVGKHGQVIALDILPMDPIAGVTFIQGDFREEQALNALLGIIQDTPIDVVISDMAPNFSGMKSVDQPRSIALVELALDCAGQILKPGGSFLAKVFQGEGVEELIKVMRQCFKQVKFRKPKSSRARSPEFYILGMGFLGYTESHFL